MVAKKPSKFPLYLHPTGQWCKKRRGKAHYFGTDKQAALKRFVDEWPDVLADRPRPGRAPGPADGADATIAYVCNAYLARQREKVRAGELTEGSWAHCRRMTLRVLAALGRTRRAAELGPADYGRVRAEAAKALGPRSLKHFLGLARGLFRFGAELTDRPPRYGDQFDPPPARVLRLHRESKGPRLLAAADLRRVLDAADPVMRAAVLLGLNCAFGATDLSELRQGHLEVRPGWVLLPRQKTGMARRCPLWPETAAALEAAWTARPRPADPADADRLFLTASGLPVVRWVRATAQGAGSMKDQINPRFVALCRRVGVPLPYRGGFYLLKRVFITEAGAARDDVAVDQITAHAGDRSSRVHYRDRVDDARLQAVVDHVRAWLWPPKAKGRRK